MRTNKNTSKIIFATVVAFLATMISYSAFKNMHNQLEEQQKLIEVMQKTKAGENQSEYAYAIAKMDLKSGEIVSDEDVDFKQFSDINANAFENRSDVVNKVLLKDILSGEIFTSSHIAKISNDDVSLRDGYRALTLPADNFQGKSNKMIPGAFVDIYSASSDNNWLLESIKIMSLESKNGSASNSETGMTDAGAITFEVPADSISSFISNISKGKLVLVARGADDKKIVRKKPKSSYSANFAPALPNLPSSVPISNFPSGLPQPIQPAPQQASVEVIEANVKSKVTFD